MSSSVSCRITRTAEDLAQTITTLSQRLLTLEQRVEARVVGGRQTGSKEVICGGEAPRGA